MPLLDYALGLKDDQSPPTDTGRAVQSSLLAAALSPEPLRQEKHSRPFVPDDMPDAMVGLPSSDAGRDIDLASIPRQVQSAGNAAMQGGGSMFTGLPKLGARILAGAESMAGAAIPPMMESAMAESHGVRTVGKDLEDYWLYAQGQKADKYIAEKFPIDERDRKRFLTKLGSGAGSMAAMVGTGLVAGPAATVGLALMGAGAEGSSQYEAAKQAGVSEDDARRAFDWGTLVGASEIAGEPLAALRVLGRMDDVLGGAVKQVKRSTLKEAAKGTVVEMGQEMGQQIGSNKVAQIYDQNRSLFDGVLEAGAIGGILGGVARGVATAVKNAWNERVDRLRKLNDQPTISRSEFTEVVDVPRDQTPPAAERKLIVERELSAAESADANAALEAENEAQIKEIRNANGNVQPGSVEGQATRQEKVGQEVAAKAEEKGADVLAPTPKSLRRRIGKAFDDYKDIVEGEVNQNVSSEVAYEQGKVADALQSGYVFTESSRSLAEEVRNALPENLKNKVRVVKPGHALYSSANGADIHGDIGASAMAKAIVDAYESSSRTPAEKMIAFAKNPTNAQQLDANTLFAIYSLNQMEKGSTETVRADALKLGESVKIDNAEFSVTNRDVMGNIVLSSRDTGIAFTLENSTPVPIAAGSRSQGSVSRPATADATEFDTENLPPGGQQLFNAVSSNDERNRANPVYDPQSRTMVDQARLQQTSPEVQKLADVRAEAKVAVDRNYETLKQQAVTGEIFNSETDLNRATFIAREIMDRELAQGYAEDNEQRILDGLEVLDQYDKAGTDIARGLGARRDLVMSPEERQASNIHRLLFQPPPKIQRQIDKIKKENERLVKKKSKLSNWAERARAEYETEWSDFAKAYQGRTGSTDVELAAKLAKLIKAAIKAKVLTYADFAADMVARIGQEAFDRIEPLVRKAWEDTTKGDRRVKKATSRRSKAIAEGPSPEMSGRPFSVGEQQTIIPETETDRRIRANEARIRRLRLDWVRRNKEIIPQIKAMGLDVDALLNGKGSKLLEAQVLGQIHARNASYWDKQYEWWINSLFGPQTQVVNIAGMVSMMGKGGLIDRAASAIVPSMLRAIGLRSDGPRFGEVKHFVKGTLLAWGQARKNALLTWTYEQPQYEINLGIAPNEAYVFHQPAIAGKKGKYVRTMTRGLGAADDAAKTLMHAGAVSAIAYRDGVNDGLSGKDLDQYMAEQIADPLSDANQEAYQESKRMALQEEGKSLELARAGIAMVPGLRYKIPFPRMMVNMIRQLFRHSPFGAIKLAADVPDAIRTGDWRNVDRRVGEQLVAWSAMLALAMTHDKEDPWITGTNHPTHPRTIRRLFGKEVNLNYGRVGPLLSGTLAMMVDVIDAMGRTDDFIGVAEEPFKSVIGQIKENAFSQGIADVIRMFEEKSANAVIDWAAKMPATFIPNIIRAPIRARRDDLPMRRVYGKTLKDRIPSLLNVAAKSTEMPGLFVEEFPQYDVWGQKVPRDGGPVPATDFAWRLLSPMQIIKRKETDADKMLFAYNLKHGLQKKFGAPSRIYKIDGKANYMTDEEYDHYVRESGLEARRRRDEWFARRSEGKNPINVDDPSESDVEFLFKIVSSSRRKVRESMNLAGGDD